VSTQVATSTTADWREAGQAWGAQAVDWAYLFEPYARAANDLLFTQLSVTNGVRLLDIACGSGLAAQGASRRGATVSGLDASAALVDIAHARTPSADFRVGDMFALPFPDGAFDVATSFNGIWKGCEGALTEARRVLQPHGRLGLTFWGPLDQVGLLPYFLKTIELSPQSHQEATVEMGDTARVIDAMLTATGFVPRASGTVTVCNEWPDVDLAVRAMAAAGPSVPAIRAVGLDAFLAALREVIEPMHVPGVGVRITSELGWVTADRAIPH
jgi:ubiquinone/menaquinone biosynthesis C-methylase UbiE